MTGWVSGAVCDRLGVRGCLWQAGCHGLFVTGWVAGAVCDRLGVRGCY